MVYAFGDYRLDAARRQLLGADAVVHLSPKAFDLLLHLVTHREKAVSKEELHDVLWPGTFVTEANLASLVAEIRRALGDGSRSSRFIRTVHRFGYAFAMDVKAEDAPIRGAETSPCTAWIVWRGQEIPLPEGESIIGRDPEATVRLDLPSVSRRHARITVNGEHVSVEDLGSKNGTLIGNTTVHEPTPLHDRAELFAGSARLVVRIVSGDVPTQTRPVDS